MAMDQSNSEDGEWIHKKQKNGLESARGPKDMNTGVNLEDGPF